MAGSSGRGAVADSTQEAGRPELLPLTSWVFCVFVVNSERHYYAVDCL